MFAILEGTYQVRNDGVFVRPFLGVGSVFLNRTSWSELEVHLIFFPWIAQINAWFLMCEPPQLLSPMVGRLTTLIFCHMLAVRVKQSLKIDSVSLLNLDPFSSNVQHKKQFSYPTKKFINSPHLTTNNRNLNLKPGPPPTFPTFPNYRSPATCA